MGADVLGLRPALQRAEEDLCYPLSAAVPLAVLAEDFADSPDHVRKVEELGKRGHTHLRRVRGDGNCFYRALCFAWLEVLLDKADRGETVEMPLPGGWPDASLFGNLASLYSELRSQVTYLSRTPAPAVGRQLLARLLVDVRFDLVAVALLRLVVATFLQDDDEATTKSGGSGGTSPVSDVLAAQAAQHGGVDNFVRTEVLPMGKDAEGASIAVAAMQLGARLCILQLDGLPGPVAEYTYPSQDYDGPFGIRVHLLFRPGHYEVLYHEDSPCFSEPESVKARCSFCREEALMPVRSLLACCHRLCPSCTQQAPGCPICSEVVPEEWHALGGVQNEAKEQEEEEWEKMPPELEAAGAEESLAKEAIEPYSPSNTEAVALDAPVAKGEAEDRFGALLESTAGNAAATAQDCVTPRKAGPRSADSPDQIAFAGGTTPFTPSPAKPVASNLLSVSTAATAQDLSSDIDSELADGNMVDLDVASLVGTVDIPRTAGGGSQTTWLRALRFPAGMVLVLGATAVVLTPSSTPPDVQPTLAPAPAATHSPPATHPPQATPGPTPAPSPTLPTPTSPALTPAPRSQTAPLPSTSVPPARPGVEPAPATPPEPTPVAPSHSSVPTPAPPSPQLAPAASPTPRPAPSVDEIQRDLETQVRKLRRSLREQELNRKAAEEEARRSTSAVVQQAKQAQHAHADLTEAEVQLQRSRREAAEARRRLKVAQASSPQSDSASPYQQALALSAGLLGALGVLGPAAFSGGFKAVAGAALAGLMAGVCVNFMLEAPPAVPSAAAKLLGGSGPAAGRWLFALLLMLGVYRWASGFECMLYATVDEVIVTPSGSLVFAGRGAEELSSVAGPLWCSRGLGRASF